MNNDLIKSRTPEEQELDRKIAELKELEEKLVQSELELVTLRAEIGTFEATYLHTVGAKLAELDEINAQITELEAKLKPNDKKIQEDATTARAQAQESADDVRIHRKKTKEKFKPSGSLKRLYREIAKRLHPDLATDEDEQIRRQKLMAEANVAYEKGDESKLRDILDEWENSPESVKGEGTAAELVRVIRKISQIKKRLHAIEIEIEQIKNIDLYDLKIKAQEAENEGRDLLAELVSQVDRKIASANKRLAEINTREVRK